MQPIIKIQSLCKSYHARMGVMRRTRHVVLKNISFAISAGQTLAVIGETGSGKSTLARILAGADLSDSGQILLDGKTIEDDGVRLDHCRQIRLIFQDPNCSLNPGITIGTMLNDCLSLNTQLTDQQRKKKIRHTLSRVGLLAEHYDFYPHMFSGGQLQRVALARALILDPKVLVLDEALSSLDPSVRAQTVNLLLDLQKQINISFILITHHLSLVKHISDSLLVLDKGQVVEYGNTNEIFTKPKSTVMKKLLSA
jgi:cationic peptide transport system ATP-binding protein